MDWIVTLINNTLLSIPINPTFFLENNQFETPNLTKNMDQILRIAGHKFSHVRKNTNIITNYYFWLS